MLARLVDVEQVAVEAAEGVPDGVAFAAVRRKAPGGRVAAYGRQRSAGA